MKEQVKNKLTIENIRDGMEFGKSTFAIKKEIGKYKTIERKKYLEMAEKYNKKSRRIIILTLIFCSICLLATGVLCIVGNDIVLRMLNL